MLRFARNDVSALLALVTLTLVFFWKLAFTNLILAGVDVFGYFYPYRAYAAQVIQEGRFPLWNPYLFMGVPFLANSQAGVLYPLNLVLNCLSAARQVSWSIILHVALAGVFAYLYARSSLRLSPWTALLAGAVFALGGFLSAQVEHVNQLSVSAWLPLLLLLYDQAVYRKGWQAGRAAVLLGGVVVGLQFLAGHTQSSYICLAGLGVYALVSLVTELRQEFSTGHFGEASKSPSEKFVVTTSVVLKATKVATTTALIAVRHLGVLFLMIALGLGLAAVQLLPTWELSQLSVRAGGLPYREAVSFSLKPRLLAYTLLPPFGVDLSQVFGSEAFTEFVAYLGILPLLLAGVGVFYGRNPRKIALIVLIGLGLFLALGGYNPVYYLLYKVVPGISLFRAPARWMLLYAFGGAMLSGVGMERIGESANRKSQIANRKWRRIWLPACFGLVCLELFVAGRALPYNHPTAPEALTSLRTAPAHILAAERGDEPYRFLSISGITYDPGDLAEIQQMFAGQLPERAIYDYVVAAKRKEILAPNLPLLYRIPSVDGYDGGALPLRRYVTLQRLFLPAEQLSADGRLREQLTQVPPARLLALLNVKYVITDKVYDVWIDNVFYDLEFQAVLGQEAVPEVTVGDLPPLAATSLGLVSYLEGGGSLSDGTPVAEVLVTDADGQEQRHLLRAGSDTAEGLYTGDEAHQQARVGHHWRDNPAGNDYITRLELGPATALRQITIRYLATVGRLHVRGLSLIDARTGASEPAIVSTSGRFRLVHSGDVKIYENLDNLPRAFLVHRARVVENDETALAAMADAGFDPGQEVLLAAETGREVPALSATDTSADRVRIAVYSAERVVVEVDAESEGYLVLTDAYYPGWQATLDGQQVSIRRADVLFRAVRVPAGSHIIEFRYQPRALQVGAAISLLTLVGIAIGVLCISAC
ncbi:MAG: YfhO family protein [Anaerolineae bacterium]|nr:YfhO family protein [Anaerolineae bacterium]MDH7475189.1 YfhO family protein [Anaerolineae bacterium]